MTLLMPTEAESPSREEASFPVDAHATVRAPNSSAFITATELARSLNEAVGFLPSSFMKSRPAPTSFASRGTSYTGVHPTANGGFAARGEIGRSSPYLQWLTLRLESDSRVSVFATRS